MAIVRTWRDDFLSLKGLSFLSLGLCLFLLPFPFLLSTPLFADLDFLFFPFFRSGELLLSDELEEEELDEDELGDGEDNELDDDDDDDEVDFVRFLDLLADR